MPAAEARLFWSAACDPHVLAAESAPRAGGFRIDLLRLPFRADVLTTPAEDHVVLVRGGQRVAIDLAGVSTLSGAAELRFSVHLGALGPQALALQRLQALLDGRRAASLWPPLPRAGRIAAMLMLLDARSAGASLRDVAEMLFGRSMVSARWDGASDFLKSRVRRLARDARHMSAGGYRRLLRRPF